ncbi:MAG TPA: hypothetical protein VMR41_05945 [Patescibacteria group bacterium]|nr:hypothetical protein [Patescibacteria group bacterium]
MAKYRIYALIHGETLQEGHLFGCEIRKMEFEEQKKRKFAPIEGVISKSDIFDYHKTYVTSLRYVDPLRIKSEYIIVCDIEEDKPGDALGGAIKVIDRITRFLSLACLKDIKSIFGENRGSFEPYIYQVNKIYALDEKAIEKDIDFKLESGHCYLPNRPEYTKWRNPETEVFLEEIYNFQDEILERSLKYLYGSSIGHFILNSGEKIALDHFKSIEIIINALSNKAKFKQRLQDASIIIGITPDEKERIVQLWEERSKFGDVAHPSPFDEAERYPNQFPIPSNIRYSGGGWGDSIAANILLKYYRYIKGVYIIDIEEIDKNSNEFEKEGKFVKIYTFFPFNVRNQNHLGFYTEEKDKNRLKIKLKKAFAYHYKIPINDIVELVLQPNKNPHLKVIRYMLRICTII